jgi:hypothetical protein
MTPQRPVRKGAWVSPCMVTFCVVYWGRGCPPSHKGYKGGRPLMGATAENK